MGYGDGVGVRAAHVHADARTLRSNGAVTAITSVITGRARWASTDRSATMLPVTSESMMPEPVISA